MVCIPISIWQKCFRTFVRCLWNEREEEEEEDLPCSSAAACRPTYRQQRFMSCLSPFVVMCINKIGVYRLSAFPCHRLTREKVAGRFVGHDADCFLRLSVNS